MKSTINGVRYDTATSIKVTETASQSRDSKFWLREALYRTPRSGRYFLAGSGNDGSRYAVRVGGEWRKGEKIIPLAEMEAREWATRRGLTEKQMAEHFSAQT